MLKTVPLAMVGSRYELQRELARGGMGSVWVAKDLKLRRLVALKVMVPMWAKSDDATQRFEREAMAVAQLQSPHVVQIFDYGVEQDCPYIVMELLEGEDLRQRLRRRERLDLETAGRVMVQSAKALSAAHAAGIIHRDLKPGNIFLVRGTGEELVKVLDFGVAKVDTTEDPDNPDEPTKAGTLLGTPQYMSPEQARGKRDIDHRADLWSLAVIIYRALVGRLPFTGSSAADVIVRICTKPPPQPTKHAPDLPAEVDRFFLRALAKDPAQRFESARQMAIAFTRIAPASFPSLSMPEPMPHIAEAYDHRQAAAADMDWDTDERSGGSAGYGPASTRGMTPSGRFVPVPRSGHRSRQGSLPSISEQQQLSELLEASSPSGALSAPSGSLSLPGVAEASPSGVSHIVTDPIAPPPGHEPPEPPSGFASPDSSGSLSLSTPSMSALAEPSSGGTLASGLVDTAPGQPASRRGRPVALWVTGVLAVLGIAAAVGTGVHRYGRAEPPSTVESDALAAPGSAEPEPSEPPPAEPTTPEPAATESSAAQGGAEPSPSASTETSAPAEPDDPTRPPHRPRPPRQPPPRPKPQPKSEPDPFSERL